MFFKTSEKGQEDTVELVTCEDCKCQIKSSDAITREESNISYGYFTTSGYVKTNYQITILYFCKRCTPKWDYKKDGVHYIKTPDQAVTAEGTPMKIVINEPKRRLFTKKS